MNRKEINQAGIFEKLKNREMKQTEAAKILGLSERQIRAKLCLYRKAGPKSLIHGLRDKPSNHRVDPESVQTILNIVSEKYPDFGPTLASEHLWDDYRLKIHHETLRLAMIDAGSWEPKKRKQNHREWRERKECRGELAQLDGSDHDWFEGRAPRCDLLAFIDDATSEVLWAEFSPETTLGVMIATDHYFSRSGLPAELYVDRGKVYKVNNNNLDNDKFTQYGRAMKELDVGMVYARSPQAKGRVERLFGTLQDRLVKEMRLKGISTIEAANQFLREEYLLKHNQKFAVAPKSKTDLHRPTSGYDLSGALCIKTERILTSDFTLRCKNRWFQLERKQNTLIFPKDHIVVVTHLDDRTELWIRSTKLNFREVAKPAVKAKTVSQVKEQKPWVPPADHPWRKYQIKKLKPEVSILQKEEVSILV